ncbi:TPA: hypothetical protein DCX15_01590 [bacterium]|nr:hypothetical protein [bacterium]
MYETMIEKALQAQETMLHPLLPRPVQMDIDIVEKTSLDSFLDQLSIHKDPFDSKRLSLNKGVKQGSLKIISPNETSKDGSFFMVLTAVMKESRKEENRATSVRTQGKPPPFRPKGMSQPTLEDGSRALSKQISPEDMLIKWTNEENLSPKGPFNQRSLSLRGGFEDEIKDKIKEKGSEQVTQNEKGGEGVFIQEQEGGRVETKERISQTMQQKDSADHSSGDKVFIDLSSFFGEGMMQEREGGFQELVYELVRGAQILKGNNKTGFRLQLKPEEFGRMEVEFVMDENKGIEIRFIVADQKTQARIASNLNPLRERLLERGVNLREIKVEFRDESRSEDLEGFHLRSISLQDLAGRIDLVA